MEGDNILSLSQLLAHTGLATLFRNKDLEALDEFEQLGVEAKRFMPSKSNILIEIEYYEN